MQPTKPVKPSGALPLALGTISFAVCFAAWGLDRRIRPPFPRIFSTFPRPRPRCWSHVPVLLGSLARLPVGMLADRFGGRLVFSLLMLACAIPCLPDADGGDATSSCWLAVSFWDWRARLSPWESDLSRVGSMPKSRAARWAFTAWAISASPPRSFSDRCWRFRFGWQNIFRGVAVVLAVWAVVFWLLARNAPVDGHVPNRFGEMVGLLARERLSWALSAFYFLTFGGFVAFSIYLPSLLRDQFHLQPADAGFRTAGFVVLATLLRPVGGWLSDRIGGARVLSAVFAVVIPFALLLAWPSMLPFTIGALGCAAMMGLGNGAVFKLVPQYFPRETGTVTGLVGAMGGLGGFFPASVAWHLSGSAWASSGPALFCWRSFRW